MTKSPGQRVFGTWAAACHDGFLRGVPYPGQLRSRWWAARLRGVWASALIAFGAVCCRSLVACRQMNAAPASTMGRVAARSGGLVRISAADGAGSGGSAVVGDRDVVPAEDEHRPSIRAD